jgi:hypothetical protein
MGFRVVRATGDWGAGTELEAWPLPITAQIELKLTNERKKLTNERKWGQK